MSTIEKTNPREDHIRRDVMWGTAPLLRRIAAVCSDFADHADLKGEEGSEEIAASWRRDARVVLAAALAIENADQVNPQS